MLGREDAGRAMAFLLLKHLKASILPKQVPQLCGRVSRAGGVRTPSVLGDGLSCCWLWRLWALARMR